MSRLSLRERQSIFARKLADLIIFAYKQGYELTLGDAYATVGHKPGSFHYKRLAIDLNLFLNGRYLERTEDHEPLGIYWESIGGTWGGRFSRRDGNHYSWSE